MKSQLSSIFTSLVLFASLFASESKPQDAEHLKQLKYNQSCDITLTRLHLFNKLTETQTFSSNHHIENLIEINKAFGNISRKQLKPKLRTDPIKYASDTILNFKNMNLLLTANITAIDTLILPNLSNEKIIKKYNSVKGGLTKFLKTNRDEVSTEAPSTLEEKLFLLQKLTQS